MLLLKFSPPKNAPRVNLADIQKIFNFGRLQQKIKKEDKDC